MFFFLQRYIKNLIKDRICDKKVENVVARSEINFYICKSLRKKMLAYSLKATVQNNRTILNEILKNLKRTL